MIATWNLWAQFNYNVYTTDGTLILQFDGPVMAGQFLNFALPYSGHPLN